ncbi:Ser/Thr protein phosphatase [Tritrichomonas foetus]|uniref:Serine/threonine-protein phosphatase n=1 Tax=Tritrichomonas foetus TaxID=1144522 RepID=A0A1J4JKT8_9EUKA|nr:Ser/Thr protein phosphatase [Tritrichomonas foetus]|eukprot:OHS99698.1 Ser/Thr protein phosphatase [Tritrichomonas foetus]
MALDDDSVADHFFHSFYPLLIMPLEEVPTVGTERYPLPQFSQKQIELLFRRMHQTIRRSGPLIHISLPVYVVGDIHGNFHDLLRILTSIDNFLDQKILFLGDYVDRGQYSLEVVILLCTLCIKYPNQFFLLRGNHEFSSVNSIYGFKAELFAQFNNDMTYESLSTLVFDYLPFAALLPEGILCLHGGLGPNVLTLDDIEQVKIPTFNYEESETVTQLVWSDPSNDFVEFNDSPRGTGVVFGRLAIHGFCKANNISKIIRGHQCVQYGVSRVAGGQIITVFSSSNYSDKLNSAGFIYIAEDESIKIEILSPLTFIERSKARFVDVLPVRNHPKGMNDSLCMNLLKASSAYTHNARRRSISVFQSRQNSLTGSFYTSANICKPCVAKPLKQTSRIDNFVRKLSGCEESE